MFPFTRKLGCFECFLNDVYSVKPRKIAVLSIVSCQQNHALNVARLLQIDVKYVAKFAFVRGNLSKRVFCRKTHRFLPLYVLGNRSIWLFLLIIWNRQILQSPQSYALRKQVRNPIASTLEILYIRFFSKFESCISCSNSSNRNFLFRLIRNNP